ncbi:(5-formylfuran-3-yl)methyl phosphate synthase [Hansschlegelia quercus]|uniref:(5-formylfuran-3-yl)methyl phosphate synthase n=1 Tax=Hansschlegelia quercus TaxID=2528245 RepID=A0A4Q9GMX1_9HYPH|nr:(5-formylfuran-3-yl)methyl phosphate synthase [Hansschlegelia quercus]TBN54515.1 hypothetical protein EYR15_06715 [Hansschlegelia quercus]
MTGFLASVASLEETALVRAGGADIVDLKDPSRGALGAWDVDSLREAVELWRTWSSPKPMLSATIGDQPMQANAVRNAAESVAAAGVPIVKLGVFADGDARACFAALASLTSRAKLIAVFFGDLRPDAALLDSVAEAGFYGAMLDTADKAAGGLRRHMDQAAIGRFVSRAKTLGLLTGLAGSLTLEDVPALTQLAPDYLGFRGALCSGGRAGRIDIGQVERISAAVKESRRAA